MGEVKRASRKVSAAPSAEAVARDYFLGLQESCDVHMMTWFRGIGPEAKEAYAKAHAVYQDEIRRLTASLADQIARNDQLTRRLGDGEYD